MKALSTTLRLLVLLGTVTLAAGCTEADKGTSTGNPMLALSFGAYDASASSSALSKMQSGHVSASSLQSAKLCLKRLRFKQAAAPEEEDNIDLALGEVTLSPQGTDLTTIELPPGTYTRIEFDLDDECGTGSSVQVTNDNGSYSTDESMTIRFDGSFDYSGARDELELQIQDIVTALSDVSSNSEVRDKAESASGSF